MWLNEGQGVKSLVVMQRGPIEMVTKYPNGYDRTVLILCSVVTLSMRFDWATEGQLV
jgi:hypothetical protein